MVKKVKILVAEDSIEWQRAHKDLLNSYDKAHIAFDIANSARDAIELAEKNIEAPYDIIITDLQMETEFLPEFAGEWLIKKIKDINVYKNTPVIIVSATYNIAFIASRLGVRYLSKRTLVHNTQAYYYLIDEILF